MSTSSGLLLGLKQADPVAWRQFTDLYGPLVYYWCRKCGLRPDEVADVFQETMAAVLAGLERFRQDPAIGRFRGWLWTVTRSKIQDHYRRQQEQIQALGGTDAQQWLAELPEDLTEVSTDGEDNAQTSAVVRRGLELVRAEFEACTWTAFWQVTVEHRSTAEVAAELGISANGVRQAKARVLRRLRLVLGDADGC